jgi:hypothetical protein
LQHYKQNQVGASVPKGLAMGRRCHPEKETGLASVGVIVPSAETFLMVQERCPSVLLNSIKKSKESSIHQKVSYFQCWLKELCRAEHGHVAVGVMWLA